MAWQQAEGSIRPSILKGTPTMIRTFLDDEQVNRIFGQRLRVRGTLGATIRGMVTDCISSGKWVPVRVNTGGNITRVMGTISATARELGYWSGKRYSVTFSDVRQLPNSDGAVVFSFKVAETQGVDMDCDVSVFEQNS